MKSVLAFFVTLFAVCASNSVSYEGYKTYKVFPKSTEDTDLLRALEEDPNYDFWSRINKVFDPITIMVAPNSQETFQQLMQENQINYEVLIGNVESVFEAERRYHQTRSLSSGKISFQQYLRHGEINAYLESLAEDYPETVTVSSIGQSYQGRDMKIIRISSGIGNSRNKSVIFIEAGIHAREWISPAVSLYVINQLVENPENQYLLNGIDWIVLPSMNPDGYEYTWNTNRMWRKTRSGSGTCIGTDGNRNLGFHWMESGGSSNACSETFAGSRAFSEPETANLRDVLGATRNLRLFISLHSYGQYVLYPYSYDAVLAENWQDHDSAGRSFNASVFAVGGKTYRVGCSSTLLYPTAGCTDDWAYAIGQAELSYCIELPGGGSQGFDLPPALIQPVVQETFEGIKAIQQFVAVNKV